MPFIQIDKTEIIPTQYKTADDKYTIIKVSPNITPEKWVIRKIYGPAWFWNDKIEDWVIVTSKDLDNNYENYQLTWNRVLEIIQLLLPTREQQIQNQGS